MTAFQHALDQGPITPEKAFALFDALAPVDPDFMIGEWAGEPFATGHPMDGALEATGWRGKRFDSVDAVHPLLFDDGKGGTFAVRPGRFMGQPAPARPSSAVPNWKPINPPHACAVYCIGGR